MNSGKDKNGKEKHVETLMLRLCGVAQDQI